MIYYKPPKWLKVTSCLLLILLVLVSFEYEINNLNCQDPVIPPSSPQLNQLWAGANKTMYEVDENIEFSIYSNVAGNVDYTIRKDRYTPIIENGTIWVSPGVPSIINFQLDHPGFLLFSATQNFQTYTTGVGVDACNISTVDTIMADFEQFWNNQKAQLAAVPINAQTTFRADKSDASQQTYKFQLDNIDGKKVHGWVSIPNCPNPQPAILVLPSYGNQTIGPYTWIAKKGAIVVRISIHDYDPELFVPNSIAYQPNCYFEDKDINYFKWGILGGIRAIDYINTLSQFNGSDVAVSGKSQGGGLAVILAGLDSRVKALSQSQAALSDHEGIINDRSSGFPYWVRDSSCSSLSMEAIRVAMSYYSVPNFAPLYNGPSLNAVGYVDEICPPSTIFSFYNLLSGQKSMIHGIDRGHNGVNSDYDAASEQFFIDQFNMIAYPQCLALLPLDLLNFEGAAIDFLNRLDWHTENEDNVSHFQIERSEDAQIFDIIGKVEASNRFGVNRYTFSDEFPEKEAYYRLKIIDNDGQYSYSDIIFLKNRVSMNNQVLASPNPFKDVIYLRAMKSFDREVEVVIINVRGKIVKKEKWKGQSELRIDCKELPGGIYTYILNSQEEECLFGKIVLQN